MRTSHRDSRVAIIGAGFAGLAAAQALNKAGLTPTVFEAKPYWGGHTHSDLVDGFTFDEGPHVSFTKDEKVIDLFRQGALEVRQFQARLTNYYRGSWVPHPAQVHLYGLDPGLVTGCIVDLVSARQRPRDVRDYADWCYNAFGKTFAENFPFLYTQKYWTVDARDLGTDWVEQRMYSPTLDEVVKGALMQRTEGDFHYFSVVRYPERGGYQSFMKALADERLIVLNKEVCEVDVTARRLAFTDGTQAYFETLISTMPLPALIAAVPARQVPADVVAASARLMCTSLVLVDIAVDRRELSNDHIFYVYDEDVSFSRAHFPHMLAPTCAPDGKGSIQVEVYYSLRRPLPCAPSSLTERVVAELVKMGVLSSPNEVLWARARDVRNANVVFDHYRAAALNTILPWIEERGILLAGRYGEWAYFWTDDAVRSGWAAGARAAALGSGNGG